MRKIERIAVAPADRERMERLIRDRNTPQKVVWRARIVLLASDGMTAEAIAAAVGKSLLTVRRWRRRFVAAGVDGLLKDATRPSRVKPLSPEVVERVVHMTLHEKPPNATHWSLRSMAKAAGISYSSVQRIWHAHGLKPHQVRDLQALARQELRRQGPGRGRALPQSSGQGAGAVRRREEPDPGARPNPARPAHEEGARRHHDPRLQAQRHHHLVRRPQHAGRQGHRRVPAAPSGPRVPELPQADRSTDTRRSRPASDPRQLRDPQDSGGQALAQEASSLPFALHTDLVVVAQHGRALLRRDHPQPHPPRCLQERCRAARLPSPTTWRSTMPTPSPSSGPSPRAKSSKKSPERNKC